MYTIILITSIVFLICLCNVLKEVNKKASNKASDIGDAIGTLLLISVTAVLISLMLSLAIGAFSPKKVAETKTIEGTIAQINISSEGDYMLLSKSNQFIHLDEKKTAVNKVKNKQYNFKVVDNTMMSSCNDWCIDDGMHEYELYLPESVKHSNLEYINLD